MVSKLPDPVEDDVDDFLADGVVSARVVVGGVLLASDKLFRMKQLTVCACAHLVWRKKMKMMKPLMHLGT